MYCKYCDYYSELDRKNIREKHISVCKLTNYIFTEDTDLLDMEYPCKDVSYRDYENSIKQRESA